MRTEGACLWAWAAVAVCLLLNAQGVEGEDGSTKATQTKEQETQPHPTTQRDEEAGGDGGGAGVRPGGEEAWRRGTEERLRESLLKGYNKHVLPYPDPIPTVVKFRITLKHFTMEENEQSVIADAWLVNEWKDPRLSWNPAEHRGIDKLTFPHTAVWKPDLDVYNSASAGSQISFGSSTLLIVFSSGRVLFVPSLRLAFTCVLDLTYWPHDRHECEMVVGSWVHDGFRIDPQILDDKPELDLATRATEQGHNLTRGWWKMLDSNLTRQVDTYPCCPEPYVTLRLSLLLERDAPAFGWTVKMPAVALSVLTVIMFLLPPCAGEKLVFGGLCLVLDLIFIAYTSTIVAHAPSHTPLIVQLVCQQLVLMVAGVVVAALTTRLARDPHSSPLPGFLRAPLLLLSTCLCLHNYRSLVSHAAWQASRRRSQQQYTTNLKTEEMELGENGTTHLYAPTTCPTMSQDAAASLDYVLLAATLDRACLVVFVVIFGVNMVSFGSVL